MLAATPCSWTLSMNTQSPQLVPPFVDRNELCAPPLFEYGTTTFPFGCTTGWPPRPDEQPAESTGPQVSAAVGRRDHAHVVARAVVVELDVAVAVVRALRPRVARDPGLVPEASVRVAGVNRVRPGQAAVGRAVDEQDVTVSSSVDPEAEREPDVVLRVERDRRVADPRPRAARVDGGSGQAAGRPRAAAVLRGRENEVARAAAAEPAAGLRQRDDRLPECERVGLELRLVLVTASSVRVRVVADRSRDHAAGGDGRNDEQAEHRHCNGGPDRPRPAPSLPHVAPDVNPLRLPFLLRDRR